MRKAGDLIAKYLREGKLNANRSEPIGVGGNAILYTMNLMYQAM